MARLRSIFAAALIGAAVSVAANGSKLAFTDYRPEADEWLAYALMAAFPFAVLALFGLRNRAGWLVAAALTLIAWAPYLAFGIPQLAARHSIDMGLAFLVITSPGWITAASVAAGLLGRPARGQRDNAPGL